jgi:SAM-dependent methyltransferase
MGILDEIRPEKFRVRDHCRLCGGGITKVLDLGSTPAANEFVTEEVVESGSEQDVFPLYLSACRKCGHVQLPVVVDPRRLFSNYVYVSGTSPVFVDHFRRYAESMIERLGLVPGDLVVDIGSNDGTLLSFFKAAGMCVLGIDPAVSIAADATARGIPTLPEFLTQELAAKVVAEHGHAKLVTANNMFAHADNLHEIALSCSFMLAPGGVFAFEVSYLPSVVDGNLFDTIYHEHTSYHHLTPLVPFLQTEGMNVFDAELVPTHGGSIRVLADIWGPGRPLSQSASDILGREAAEGYTASVLTGFTSSNDYPLTNPMEKLAVNVQRLFFSLKRLLIDVRAAGKTVAGFGAPAKVTTLMHRFQLGREDIDFIVDDAPLKQGLFTPGKYVPVLPSSALYGRRPDYVIILAWNFAEPIMRSHKRFSDEGGKFIVPIPQLKVYPS